MLVEFLEKKPLYYTTFDPTRIVKAYDSISKHLVVPKVVHIIGTNGKGTTGRYLAQMLMQAGFITGHYTSPHIHEFNERIWINGSNTSMHILEEAFLELNALLEVQWQESLSYFEYTTLLAMVAFKKCDYVVLEAGLGGEYDATSIFKKELTVVTPIGIDHQDFLGDTLDEIVSTKLNAIQDQAVVSLQSKPAQVCIENYFRHTPREVIWVGSIDSLIKKLPIVDYLKQNMQTAFMAFKQLALSKDIDFSTLETLKGRFYALNDKIRIDVGHNPLAAGVIKRALGKSKVILVYNSYKDKAYKEILATLKANITHVEIIDVKDERIVSRDVLEDTLRQMNIDFRSFSTIDPTKEYLVFGSFSVVEAFLERYNG